MQTPDLLIGGHACGDHALAVNPFVSNRYHFGMLLGVADLDAEQAYHRGKQWLHNAWLHGPGCIWGLGVELRADRNEVAVLAGLAIDAHGRELLVSDEMCVDITRWYEDKRPDDLAIDDHGDGTFTFEVHVELCHESCLDRPVPSISEPCEDVHLDTAYSRSIERGLPRIVAGPAPAEPDDGYGRLRQFAGEEPVTDPLVQEALDAVSAAADADKPIVRRTSFRRLAAADSVDLAPHQGAPSWSPWSGDGCVPLADLRVTLRDDNGALTVVDTDDATTIDPLIRPTHVRTRTAQELGFDRP